MTGFDIFCAVLGLPCLLALAWACNGAMTDRRHFDLERRRRETVADAIEAEYRRREVRRAIDGLDLPR